ncbi:hypothetical protein NDU88_004570 [Pleurodeles waltl]|uniref:VWFA domain-containing protein n=1 Tax=Pleurodeles waltl TaxID=8319 RepID=A0AAV7PCW8_PLEWA|nr:hypothetical protein NDU88_004570 [Pleurodeles waltl]
MEARCPSPAAYFLLSCLGFFLTQASNIATDPFSIIHGNGSIHFGHRVLQFREHNTTWIIVGAPGEKNNTGKIFQCHPENGSCKTIKGTDSVPTPHLGLTLEGDQAASRFIACGPGIPHQCEDSTFLHGLCYVFESGLKMQEITPGYQECVKGKVDLVFLFDGSDSMTGDQFKSITDFMIRVMDRLQNTTIQFAAVQFSQIARTEFTFNKYQRVKDPRKLLENVQHMRSLTFTFKALQYVIKNIFTASNGSRPDAKKVMIIITDGEANDGSLHSNAVQNADKMGIFRYIIGLGSNFQSESAKSSLNLLASKPPSDHIKVLDSFDKLQTVFEEIQNKLFSIEGTSNASSFVMELSSGGFSAALSPDLDVLGAVGAHNWAGGLIELRDKLTQENFINISSLSEDMEYAYLGYSLKLIRYQAQMLYAAGAPRYQYIGKVTLFAVNTTSQAWTIKQDILGTQIGSYFGSELCSVDLDGDQETDVLLIAAPLYHEDRLGGRVHVCSLTQDMVSCHSVLSGEVGHPFARFGAAIATLADLNGDGFTDIAIGAPLENESKGAVYIFHGQKGGVDSHYSQRISGLPGLKYFGQSLHGLMDLDGDRLTDITVGASGQVVILRSRPILNVSTSMSFHPQEILLKMFECSGEVKRQQEPGNNITLCFNSSYVTSAYLGHLSFNLTYRLELDANRMKIRVVFQNGKRVITDTLLISKGLTCVPQAIFLPSCIEDYVSAIKVSVNISLQEDMDSSEGSAPSPILNPLYNTTWYDEIPFEKNCGSDGICEADLKVTFDASGDKQLIVKESATLNMRLNLGNNGEDAYSTKLLLNYPAGLSYRKVSVFKTMVDCAVLPEQDTTQATSRNLSCNIAHPIFKRDTQTLLSFLFDVLGNSSWGDFLDMKTSVSSDYEDGTLLDNEASLRIPVKYAINVIGTGLEGSTKYVNFTVGNQEIKSVKHSYKVFMMEPNSLLPWVTVTIAVPVQFTTELWWDVENVTADPHLPCHYITEDKSYILHIMRMNHTENVKVFQCEVHEMNMTEFHIEGNMFISKKPQSLSPLSIKTVLWIHFNTSRYISMYPGEDFSLAQITTKVELIVPADYFKIILGSSVGGLVLLLIIIGILCKVGFFNRKYKEKMTGDCNSDLNSNQKPKEEESEKNENEAEEPLNKDARDE